MLIFYAICRDEGESAQYKIVSGAGKGFHSWLQGLFVLC